MVDRITEEMTGAPRRVGGGGGGGGGGGAALGGGDAWLAQSHHRVTLPLPVHPPGPAQTQTRPDTGGTW